MTHDPISIIGTFITSSSIQHHLVIHHYIQYPSHVFKSTILTLHIITMNDYYPLANSANTLCQAVDLLVASCNKMAPITVSVLLSLFLSSHRLNNNAINSISSIPIHLYSKQTCLGRRWKTRKKPLDL